MLELNIDQLVALENAFNVMGIPWVKGIRTTSTVKHDGVYFNSAPGVNLVAVTIEGITMPTILNTKFGIELSTDSVTDYTYDELLVCIMDSEGPSCAKLGIDRLKYLAETI